MTSTHSELFIMTKNITFNLETRAKYVQSLEIMTDNKFALSINNFYIQCQQFHRIHSMINFRQYKPRKISIFYKQQVQYQ